MEPNENASNQSQATHILVCTISICVNAMAVLGNVLNLLVLPRVSNITDTYRFLLICLAVTDLSAGLVNLSYLGFSVQAPVDDPHDSFWCRLVGYLAPLLAMNDVAVVMSVAIYKYVMITKPLRYSIYLSTRKVAAVTVVLLLILAVLLGFCGTDKDFMDQSTYQYFFGTCMINFGEPSLIGWTAAVFTWAVFVPVVIVCTLYAHIAVIARRQAKRVAILSVSSAVANSVALCERQRTDNGSDSAAPAPRKRPVYRVSAWKGLKSAILLTVGFTVAWVPFTIVFLLIATEAISDDNIPSILLTVIGNLVVATTWWNVVVYSLSSSDFRLTAATLLRSAWNRMKYCGGSCNQP